MLTKEEKAKCILKWSINTVLKLFYETKLFPNKMPIYKEKIFYLAYNLMNIKLIYNKNNKTKAIHFNPEQLSIKLHMMLNHLLSQHKDHIY